MSQVPDYPRPPLPWILLFPCPLPCFPSLPFFVLQELIQEGERLRLEGRENWESAPGHAHDCLCKAAECGNAHALWLLGRIYQYGWLQQELDHAKSLDFYERAAAKDDALTLGSLGRIYQFGYLEQEPDHAKSLDFYERAAAKDDAYAWSWGKFPELREHEDALWRLGEVYVRLGEVYEHGQLGQERDHPKSLDFYERAEREDAWVDAVDEQLRKRRSWVDEDACGGGEEGGEGDGTGEMAEQSSALLADPAEPQGKGDGESDGEKAGHSLVAFPLSADPAAARLEVEEFFDGMGPPGQIEEKEAGGI